MLNGMNKDCNRSFKVSESFGLTEAEGRWVCGKLINSSMFSILLSKNPKEVGCPYKAAYLF